MRFSAVYTKMGVAFCDFGTIIKAQKPYNWGGFMKLIDIHIHIYPDKIARKATDSVRDFYQLQGSHMDGTVEMLLE